MNFVVNCAHDAVVPAAELLAHPRNPNEHPHGQIELFQAILAYQGWRRPITVSTRSGFVVKGHGALMAARAAGAETVPVDYQDYPDDSAEMADMVADNQLARMSEMDVGKLEAITADLQTANFNVALTGLTTTAVREFDWSTEVENSKGRVDGQAPNLDGLLAKVVVTMPKGLAAEVKDAMRELIASRGGAWDGVKLA